MRRKSGLVYIEVHWLGEEAKNGEKVVHSKVNNFEV